MLIEGVMTGLTDDNALLLYLISQIEAHDGYMYYRKTLAEPMLRRSRSFHYVCCQDTSIQHQVPDDDRLRVHYHMETYGCGGNISGLIDRENGFIYLKINHLTNHPSPVPRPNVRVEMPSDVREYIVRNAHEFTAQPLYRNIISLFPAAAGIVTQQQVSDQCLFAFGTMIM